MVKEKKPQGFPTWMKILAVVFFIFAFCYMIFVIIPDLRESSEKQYQREIEFEKMDVRTHCYIGCLNYKEILKVENNEILIDCMAKCINYADFFVDNAVDGNLSKILEDYTGA